MSITPADRGANPFSTEGITRGTDGISRYADLPGTLIEMLHVQRDGRGDDTAVIEIGGGTLTFGSLWEQAARVAGGLREAGVRRGDRVALLTPAGTDWVLAFFGTLLAGAVAVPVNTRFARPEIDYVIGDCGATVTLDRDLPLGQPYVDDEVDATDIAAIFYTSGTTGRPKGATITHEAFLSNVENSLRGMKVPDDQRASLRTLISVPLFHVTGCNSQLLITLSTGGTSVILPQLEVPALLRAIGDYGINWITTVPAIYRLAMLRPEFTDLDRSVVRYIGYGGAPITTDLVRALRDAFPHARLRNGFGMTEAASLLTVLPDEYADSHPDSVGFACPVVDLAIDEPDDHGVGELLARGPNVTGGYWNNPDATDAVFEGQWLRTGDLARIDGDGLLYVVDRSKDMINRGGENVYSVEVENALASVPGVAESAVVGVPDDVMGEKVGAVIVPRDGARIDPADVVAHLRDRLADFKIPQYIAIAEQPLPRNPGGKLRKPEIRTSTRWGAPLR